MFETVASSDPRTIKAVRAIGSRKRKAYVCNYRAGGTYSTGWDDGSRDEYRVLLKNGNTIPLPGTLDVNRNGDPYNQRYVFPQFGKDWDCVVRYGTCMGKPATPTIMRPEPAATPV
jgi:hypothetical protein